MNTMEELVNKYGSVIQSAILKEQSTTLYQRLSVPEQVHRINMTIQIHLCDFGSAVLKSFSERHANG